MGNSQRKFQGYKSAKKIDSGCFGTVYKVTSKGDSKVYALKETYRGKSQTSLETLRREAEIHEELPYHKNVVRFIECFHQEYKTIIVVEFCSLGCLNNYVVNNDIPEKSLTFMMFDIARGLQHIHRYDILHRDIKPDNVLLSPGKFGVPKCKLCDFGSAKRSVNNDALASESDRPGTDDAPMMYTAPEMTSGFYSFPADVFAMGVLFFGLFSRQITEYKGRKLLEPNINEYPIFTALESVVEAEVRRCVSRQRTQELIINMLRKSPKERWTIAEALEKMHQIFESAIMTDTNGLSLFQNGHMFAKDISVKF